MTDIDFATQYHALFTLQLGMMKERLAQMAIFAPDAIRREAKEIFERYERLEGYARMTTPGAPQANGLTLGLNGLDGGASAASAKSVLIQAETRQLQAKAMAHEVARTGVFVDPAVDLAAGQGAFSRRLDGAGLVYVLQRAASESREAEAESLTEEMNQLSRLLKDYSEMQKLVNETLSQFDPLAQDDPDESELLGLKGREGGTVLGAPFSDADRLTISMFERLAAPVGNPNGHPLEEANGVTRPLAEMVAADGSIRLMRKEGWDSLAKTLGDATKLLNQSSQMRMDEISKINREKNRSYELATGTLTKLTDILRAIVN